MNKFPNRGSRRGSNRNSYSSNSIDGWDSILSILQMPSGVPVATVALNGAKNAGLLAANIIGVYNIEVQQSIIDYKQTMKESVLSKKL